MAIYSQRGCSRDSVVRLALPCCFLLVQHHCKICWPSLLFINDAHRRTTVPSNAQKCFRVWQEGGSPLCHLSPDPLLIVSVSKVAWLLFDVQTPSFSQRRLTAGAERGRWAATGCSEPDVSLPLSSALVQSALPAQAVVEHLWNHGVCTIVLTVNDFL